MIQPQTTEGESQELAQQMPQDMDLMNVEAARAVAQVQAQILCAKKFRRDEVEALVKIKQAAQRRRLAESAEYEYPRGGQRVSGPSIRAAEAVALAWGNISFGVTEIKRDVIAKESLALAWATDLESNVTKAVTFAVPHTVDKQGGATKYLKDARDIYERVMNDGSRRVRNCILAVIPQDVMDDFIDECNKTLSASAEPIAERIKKLAPVMAEIGVTQAMIENALGCKIMAISERQIAQLRRQYQAIKDGFGKVEDFFKTPLGSQDAGKAAALNEKLKAQAKAPEPAKDADPSAFENFK